jgi:acetylornithine deacetylase/succinyl-diaminopimelate desuccinylase family protein
MNTAEQRLLDAVDDAAALELLRGLIRIPGENPPGEELGKANYLAGYFADHGLPVRLHEVLPGRPNVITEVVLGAGAAGPTMVFNGHLDTVPAGEGWTRNPFGADIDNGRVYGRGAADMLAGIAAMSTAATALAHAAPDLDGRLLVHAVVDEEAHSHGSRHAAAGTTANWVIVAEPSGGTIGTHGKGQVNVDFTFTGRAAHSSRPEAGHNAIHDAAAFVARVERANLESAVETTPAVGPRTYGVGIINGGTNASTVPAECTVTVDRRVLPTETPDEAIADLHRLLDEVRADRPHIRSHSRPTLVFPPLPEGRNQILADTLRDAIGDVDGSEAPLIGFTGATDAAWYAQRDIPAVIYGPGDIADAHQPDESVAIDSLESSARALALTAMRLLRRP